jgi:hypothetical protein
VPRGECSHMLPPAAHICSGFAYPLSHSGAFEQPLIIWIEGEWSAGRVRVSFATFGDNEPIPLGYVHAVSIWEPHGGSSHVYWRWD